MSCEQLNKEFNNPNLISNQMSIHNIYFILLVNKHEVIYLINTMVLRTIDFKSLGVVQV